MELNEKQLQGLRIAVERYRNRELYTTIAGYAGTGKSTLIKFIVAELGLEPMSVGYVAYTGKAAQVLRSKGCPTAITAHRLLYKSIQREDGTFVHIPKNSLPGYSLIVVDEISMLPDKMWQLLLSHHIHVIACGDPFQLPPVSSDDNHVLEHPHIFLDEIMRQEAESEIIRLSMDIRNRKTIKPFKGKEINIVEPKDFVDGMLVWADQVLCGKNATRHDLNTYFRALKWGERVDTSVPLVGDKIICLHNNWDIIAENGDALVNGVIGELTQITTYPDKFLEKKCLINFLPEGEDKTGSFNTIMIDWKLITTHKPTVTRENFSTFPRWLRPEQFDYGYVVTCWKAQGSEYDKVTFIAEKVGKMSAEMYARYLYTGVTRAASRLTLVLNT